MPPGTCSSTQTSDRNTNATGPTGSAEQPASTRPATWSGARSAVSIATYPPSDSPTRTARPDGTSASIASTTALLAAARLNLSAARSPWPGRSIATHR